MEEGEGEGGPGKLTGGTGLGEGEGQKDVSDKIENQVKNIHWYYEPFSTFFFELNILVIISETNDEKCVNY